ncbi:MAG: DM13 domain-containing protein [Dehalococcoidia bacterium]|nr:DM13 domain-containing protein [Dehalococcoidia bacterium]
MRKPLARVPWHMGAPAFLVCAVALAIATNLFGGDYFKRTFLEEENPLAAGGSGGPAAVASVTPSPAAGTPVAAATTAGSTAPAGPVVLASGMFRDGAPGHHGKGTAKLGRDAAGKAILVFEGFSVTNGPDLHVILGATADGGGEGLDLGGLKATDGTFSYEVPDGADLESFKSVTIFCKSFPTVFAVATLEVM